MMEDMEQKPSRNVWQEVTDEFDHLECFEMSRELRLQDDRPGIPCQPKNPLTSPASPLQEIQCTPCRCRRKMFHSAQTETASGGSHKMIRRKDALKISWRQGSRFKTRLTSEGSNDMNRLSCINILFPDT
jgi:hypothetical protein